VSNSGKAVVVHALARRVLLALLSTLSGCGTGGRQGWGQLFQADYFINSRAALRMLGGDMPIISGACWAFVQCQAKWAAAACRRRH
jgi:hypothetical protein